MVIAWIVSICLIGGIKDTSEMRMAVTDGNVRTKFFNCGSVGGPDRVYPWPRMEWPAGSGHEYLYESGLVIGAKVRAYNPSTGDSVTIWIVDDGIQDAGDWELLPVRGFADPNSDTLAISTNPQTWPSEWPSYLLAWGDTVHGLSGQWAGDFGVGNIVADQEGFWVMSDSANTEFIPGNSYGNPYYDPGNGLSGLGLIVYGRSYVIHLDGVDDAVIFSYTIHNVSGKRLDSLTVGIFSDVRIGGPGSDFLDDLYEYDTNLRTVRFYDSDGIGRDPRGQNYECGQLGLVFLQTPGNSEDGIDNDGDGMVDESPSDLIDNDGDWDPTTDDVGRDGLPNTGDEGEGDGMPTWGEPNFDWRDPDEVDEIGMTAVDITPYGDYVVAWDAEVGERMEPGHFWPTDSVPVGDCVTLASSGFFSLDPGQWAKFVVAYVMADGRTWDELLPNLMATVSYYRNYLGVGLRMDIEEDDGQHGSTQTPVLMVRSVASAKGALQFRLTLPHNADVRARLFDISGRLVAKRDYGILTAGIHMLSLQPQTLPSGVYFLEVKAANYRMVKRLVLFR